LINKRPTLLTLFLCAIAFSPLLGCSPANSDVTEKTEEVSISGVDDTVTLNAPHPVNASISSIRGEILIKSNVRELKITGIENNITIETGVVIESIHLSGIRNDLSLPFGYKTVLTQGGSSNTYTYRE
jgi:hypothetical protein